MKLIPILFILALQLFVTSPIAQARDVSKEDCIDTVCFTKEIQAGEQTIVLLGRSLFRYWMVDVYSAALYGPEDWRAKRDFQTDAPSILVIEYHRAMQAADLVNAANDVLSRQNEGLPPEVVKGVAKIHSLYKDIYKGDRYELRYHPEGSTGLWLNGDLVGVVHGREFAKYYFRIWLDSKHPLNTELREDLFGPKIGDS